MTRAMVVVLMCARLVLGQNAWDRVQQIPAGQQVRVETATQKHTGELMSVSDNSVRLDAITVARSEVTRVYAKSGSHRKRNAVIGTAIGVGVGIAFYATFGLMLRNEGGENTEAMLVIPAAAGAAIGAALPASSMKKVYDAKRR
jgi:hypothetical protein